MNPTEQKPTVDVVLEKNGVTIRCTAYAGGPSLDSVIEIASAALKKTAPARAPRAKAASASGGPAGPTGPQGNPVGGGASSAAPLKRTLGAKKLVPVLETEADAEEEVPSTVTSAKKRAWKKEIEKDSEEGDGDWVASEEDRGSADDSDSGDSLDKAFIDNSVDELVEAVVHGAVESSSSEESGSSDSDSDDVMSVPSNPLRSPVPAGRARKAKTKGSLRTSFMAKLDAAELPPRAPKKPRMSSAVILGGASDSEDHEAGVPLTANLLRYDTAAASPAGAPTPARSPDYVPVAAPVPPSPMAAQESQMQPAGGSP